MRIIAFTHTGPHRPRNEDALFLAGSLIAGPGTPAPVAPDIPEASEAGALLAVIDGMGGQAGGATAARLLARALPAGCGPAADAGAIRAGVERALDRAARAMREAAARDPQLARMGAALAGAVFGADALVVFNCGDCRVYRQQGPYLDKLSHDHSLVQELCDRGELDEEAMRRHPRRNLLSSCVSAEGDGNRRVFFRVLPPGAARRLFLCSDGVWEALALEEMEDCLANRTLADGAAELARRLLNPARDERRDNLSFVLAEPDGPASPACATISQTNPYPGG